MISAPAAIESFLSKLLGRTDTLFAEDYNRNSQQLAERIRGSKTLVVGAAGAIGRAFCRRLVEHRPRVLHLLDLSENNLVELIRELRATPQPMPDDLRSFCVAFGSEAFRRLVDAEGPYDHLINFAALKHVRSERDVYSLMRMIETNAGCLYDLLRDGEATGRGLAFGHAFSVSSDKATAPTNAMGASKRLMERVHLCYAERLAFSSARFANVAFSDGSLLDGWTHRLAKGQPLSGPSDVSRYFMSAREAAELCLLACFLGANGEIFFPRLDPKRDLVRLDRAAADFLRHLGYEPAFCSSQAEALERAAALTEDSKSWPCYFTPSKTSGEKSVETFHLPEQTVDLARFTAIGVIQNRPRSDRRSVDRCFADLRSHRTLPSWSKEAVIAALRIAVPEFRHLETGRDLDQDI